MHHYAKITGKVRSDNRKPSPLANNGLEIIINIEVDWGGQREVSHFNETSRAGQLSLILRLS